jgi:hypothetical protein
MGGNMLDETKVARLAEIRAVKNALEKEEKELVAEFSALEQDAYAVGPFKVEVTPNNRFDPALAEKLLETEAQRRKVTKRVVDSTLFKVHYPDLYPLAQKSYANKVTVTVPGD